MPAALVTGAVRHMEDVFKALDAESFQTTSVGSGETLADACADIAGSSLDAYVQLPLEVDAWSADGVEDLRALLSGALLARFDALAAVAPLLAPRATVVLVPGDRVGETSDAHLALPSVFGVLARAVLAQHGAGDVRTIVVEEGCAAVDIAALVAPEPLTPAYLRRRPAPFTGMDPGASYSDWRDDLFFRAG